MAIFLIFVCVTLLFPLSRCISEHPIIVIIAFDGFAHDYIDKGLTPVLEELKRNGTTTEFMYNVFPTVTYPNFFSISTGLYPETHGVTGNVIFNENFDCLRGNSYELFHYNEDVIPIWTLNELSGKNRHSGVMAWPSATLPFVNKQVTFMESNGLELHNRVDKIIEWVLHESTPANMIFLYFGELDGASHMHGPDSEEVKENLRTLNNITEYLLQKLSDHGIRDKVNLMFLSDHGMAALPAENIIDFHSFIQKDTYLACGESPVWQIQYKPGYKNEIYENLTRASAEKQNAFKVYKHEEIPERWHIKNCKRKSDLLLVANMNYGFSDASVYKGDHGYDIAEKKMRPFFLANGPRFKQNFKVQPFNNIDIYPLLVKLLDLNSPPDNVRPNGTLTVIKDILVD